MDLGSHWIVWPVMLPLIGATAAFVAPRAAASIGLVTALVTTVAVGAVTRALVVDGVQRYTLAGWSAPLGIALYADGLSVVMLLMVAVVGAISSLYAAAYFRQDKQTAPQHTAAYFWPLWLFLWAALNAIIVSGDLFNLYVGLELLGLSAVALIGLALERKALIAGMRYLLVSLLGSLAYLLGVALLYGAFGTLDLAQLGTVVVPGPATWFAIALIVTGLALKTALFPLHFWLPPAHASAPAPVSALLSALVVKASFYLLLRLWFAMFPIAPPAAHVLGGLGALGILWGSLLALRQRRLKLIIAYSTVAQVGYLFLLFPLAGAAGWGGDAWNGGVYQAFSHACAKAAMFLAAGALAAKLGTDDLAAIDGALWHAPLAVTAFALGGVSLMGLPPSGGFTAKWLLLVAAFETGQWWLAAIILVGSLLAAAYVFHVLQCTLAAPAHASSTRPTTRSLELPAFGLALIAIGLGLVSAPLLSVLQIGGPGVIGG